MCKNRSVNLGLYNISNYIENIEFLWNITSILPRHYKEQHTPWSAALFIFLTMLIPVSHIPVLPNWEVSDCPVVFLWARRGGGEQSGEEKAGLPVNGKHLLHCKPLTPPCYAFPSFRSYDSGRLPCQKCRFGDGIRKNQTNPFFPIRLQSRFSFKSASGGFMYFLILILSNHVCLDLFLEKTSTRVPWSKCQEQEDRRAPS